jgi:hypothetical protein
MPIRTEWTIWRRQKCADCKNYDVTYDVGCGITSENIVYVAPKMPMSEIFADYRTAARNGCADQVLCCIFLRISKKREWLPNNRKIRVWFPILTQYEIPHCFLTSTMIKHTESLSSNMQIVLEPKRNLILSTGS